MAPSFDNDQILSDDRPPGESPTPERVRKVVAQILGGLRDPRGALLPILHGIQEEFSYVPSETVPTIAEELNLTRAEVHGVVSFYQDFRAEKPGRHILKICQAESCQALGSRALTASVRSRLGIGFHETTDDDAFTLEPVYCLGNCSLSPAVQVDSEIYGRVSESRLNEIIEQTRGRG